MSLRNSAGVNTVVAGIRLFATAMLFLTLSVHAAGRAPPVIDPDDPDYAPQVQACLNSEGANTAAGRVHNRFLWCQRWSINGGLGVIGTGGATTNASTFELHYTAVAFGRDDGNRNIHVFFRGDNLIVVPLKGSIRPESLFTQSIACNFASCFVSPPNPVVKPFSRWLHQWTRWIVNSDTKDPFGQPLGPDEVLTHQWHFRGSARSVLPDGKSTPVANSDDHAIRCDSAPYFRGRTKACIFDDTIPHLQYSAALDSPVKGVADHIRCAQNTLTCATYPEADLKLIPGTYIPGVRGPGLHRIPGANTKPPGNQRAVSNRGEVRRACNRVGRYSRTGGQYPGLPANLLDSSKQDCDEYPFASTWEGAALNGTGVNAVGTPQFSVLGVNSQQNVCAGNKLKSFYRDDRILYFNRDTFYVRINDVPDTSLDPCPVLLDGDEVTEFDWSWMGGGMPIPGDTVTLDAGPDVTGFEGSSTLLAATVSGALSLQWSYAPGPDVSPGATCSFNNTQSATTRITCSDNGTYTATLTASNGAQQLSDSVQVEIRNRPPTLHLTSPVEWQVFRAGTPVKVVAPFTDPGANDTHDCVVAWDDGSVETYTAGDESCDRSHSFSSAGMYTIPVTVRDDDGGSATQPVMIVVYDPDGGFVTGGGHLVSPPGAWNTAPGVAASAYFEFNPKYHKKDQGPMPSGGKLHYRIDRDFELDASSFAWLVITQDRKAALRGTAIVNGQAGYGFVLYGYGDNNQLRLVVWSLAESEDPPARALYDTNVEAGYDLDDAQPVSISAGSIQIHR